MPRMLPTDDERKTMSRILQRIECKEFLLLVKETFEELADPSAEEGSFDADCYSYASAIDCVEVV